MILQHLGIPIYIQVKNHILDKIKTGEYPPGAQIPTERQMAVELAISRNTVSTAYKDLLDQGILEARQGRGTFVRRPTEPMEAIMDVSASRRERVLRIIDHAMMQALEMGFTLDQFSAFVNIRAKEKEYGVKELRVAVVDCTAEYIHHFIQQIGMVVKAKFEGVVLKELEEGQVPVELLQASDLVVTTTSHQHTVGKLLGSTGKILAVSSMPNLDSVVRMAKLPAHSRVGVVAETPEYVEALERLFAQTNFSGLRLETLLNGSQEEVAEFVGRHSVVITTANYEGMVRKHQADGHEIITFYYEIDQGSLQQVAARLVGQA